MDPAAFRYIVVGPAATLGFVAALLAILQWVAQRRGGSLLRDLGARGWVVALEVVLAAGLFSSIIASVVQAPYNIPPSWDGVLMNGVISGALGVGVFLVAFRQVDRGVSGRVGASPGPQKG